VNNSVLAIEFLCLASSILILFKGIFFRVLSIFYICFTVSSFLEYKVNSRLFFHVIIYLYIFFKYFVNKL